MIADDLEKAPLEAVYKKLETSPSELTSAAAFNAPGWHPSTGLARHLTSPIEN